MNLKKAFETVSDLRQARPKLKSPPLAFNVPCVAVPALISPSGVSVGVRTFVVPGVKPKSCEIFQEALDFSWPREEMKILTSVESAGQVKLLS